MSTLALQRIHHSAFVWSSRFACIILLKPSGKIVKLQNECTEFSHNEEFRSKISETSCNFHLKTSCALPPYYSLELNLISSTSHYIRSRAPASRILMICCVSRAKMYSEHRKIIESCSFALFFLIWDGFVMVSL